MVESWGDPAHWGSPGARGLPPRALAYRNTRTLVDGLGIGAIIATVAMASRGNDALVLVTLALSVVLVVSMGLELTVIDRLQIARISYTVSADFVYIVRGIAFRTVVVIPAHQILAVETVEGPVLRRFGFVKARFRCLTTSEELGPLDAAAVAELQRILFKTHRSAGDVLA